MVSEAYEFETQSTVSLFESHHIALKGPNTCRFDNLDYGKSENGNETGVIFRTHFGAGGVDISLKHFILQNHIDVLINFITSQ